DFRRDTKNRLSCSELSPTFVQRRMQRRPACGLPQGQGKMPEPPKLPPVANQPLSLVLLAREAEAHVQDLVRAWDALLSERKAEDEILLVDDGSTDRTAALAEELTASVPALKVLKHESQRGPGVALRTGLGAARLPLVAYAPCDPAYEPATLTKFLSEIDRVHILTGF